MLIAPEPIGAEAAIGWHIRQIDWHNHNESMADACDMPGCAELHAQKRREHRARLTVLEAEFPETARICHAQYEVESQQIAENA